MADTSVALSVEPLREGLGVRLHGLDLGDDGFERHGDYLRRQFAEHAVMAIACPQLTPERHVRFAAIFGKVDADKIDPDDLTGMNLKGQPKRGILFISNKKGEDGGNLGALPDGELHFHSDGAHRPSPYRATTLYSLEIPSRGGETKFADLRAAWDALAPDMQRRIEGLQVQNVYDTRATLREQTDETDDRLSNAIHPLVRVHPDTGRKSLYLSRLMTRKIVGMDRAQSDDLLAALFDHIEKDEFIYAHRWAVGELLLWDNRSVNHARNDFPANEARHMRRVTVSEP